MSLKRTLIVPAILMMSLVAGAAYAEQSQTNPMGNGQMMGKGGGMQGMGGMMNMMSQASQMMETCNGMMSSAGRTPNSQWKAPDQAPGNKG